MQVVLADPPPDAQQNSILPRRPALALSILADLALAITTYFVTYWLRFGRERLEMFLPGAWSTLAFVVMAQLAALGTLGAYARLPRLDWLIRVVAGAAVGTIAAIVLVGVSLGFGGVSRSAFVADGILFSIAAIAWRGVWGLRARARARANARMADGELVDRTGETTTLRAGVRSLYSYRELVKNLVLKDIKLKYRGSVFGFLWSLANPLLMMVVYTVAFTYVLRVRSEGFVFSLLLGLLSWTLFSSSASMSTGAIVDNAGLLKSVLFPRAILPISTVLFNVAQYLLTISVFLPAMMFWHHVPPSPSMLLFPVFLALQVIFTIGVALILATATAFFRDVRHLLEVALSMLFWTTPIVYELGQVPERLRLLILLSPVSPFVVAYQQMVFYRSWPESSVWLIASVYAFGTLVVGAVLFLACEERFMEQL
jgi:ABC-2 type transport system permease protein